MSVGNLMQVGIRELRDNLSRRLDEVRAGRTITVTDHGRPIARLVPVDETSAFNRLVAEGRIVRAESHERTLPPPVVATGSVSDFIAEQRG
ncbi:MAG TPA: type II toxin-antitoxin system prevent-host-death family antitoxin [Homoserinimonas sp.]|nr:type II toxin-antitoxin system prevent-host-death family antitoxin [Homoserinimonas sp.]